MAKYRKKPVVIEAIQFKEPTQHNYDQICWFCHADLKAEYFERPEMQIVIPTLEGEMRASVGDWVIKGVKGEVYPCKPDIFAATYEEVK